MYNTIMPNRLMIATDQQRSVINWLPTLFTPTTPLKKKCTHRHTQRSHVPNPPPFSPVVLLLRSDDHPPKGPSCMAMICEVQKSTAPR